MGKRISIPKSTETEVLTGCRRRCCLCVFLSGNEDVMRGQIAHLNRDRTDARSSNLVYLCLTHHDEYDSQTSQSKGLTEGEVRKYRDQLKARFAPTLTDVRPIELDAYGQAVEMYRDLLRSVSKDFPFLEKNWEFPLWQVANRPELFAFKAHNGSDGVCLIERIDIPDGRIVIACTDPLGNPGISVTNAIEEICFQVCYRFGIPANRLVWLESYEEYGNGKWHWVRFESMPPTSMFQGPKWQEMTQQLWKELQLGPQLESNACSGHVQSRLKKYFDWPSEALPSF